MSEASKVSQITRAKALFNELKGVFTQHGGRVFRKQILTTLVAEYKCSVNSAAGAYNAAKKSAQASEPKFWEALGRPEGKNNGGAKKKSAPVAETSTPA